MIMFETVLNNAASDSVIAYRKGKSIPLHEFSAHIASLCATLSGREERSWILFSEDAYLFATGFLALLHTGKTVYMPHNAKAGTLAEMYQHAEAFIGDAEIETMGMPALPIDGIGPHSGDTFTFGNYDVCEIVIATSGSTGKPKLIRKRFKQLRAEVTAIQKTWGERARDAVFLSTVSHQHIYGLLFRVLWPLVALRPLVAENFHYPEELLANIGQYTPAVLISSPANLKALSLIEDTKTAAGKLRMIFSSGGPLLLSVSQALQRMLDVPVVEVLGSSETGGVAHRIQVLSVDTPTPWTSLSGVSIDASGIDAQLMVRSPYAGSDDWVAMGDTATIADDGRFVLGARIDRVVKVEGKRLSLAEMEGRLCDIGLIAEARVLPVSGKRDAIGAVIVLSDAGQQYIGRYGKQPLTEYIRNELLHYFESVVLPKKWRFVSELPVNEQSKVTHESLLSLFHR
jgi:acyl-coenzyme A synthetase/AMP-(fatty) acid ligase